MTDIMWLIELLKEKGFTLEDVKKMLENKREELLEKKHVREKDVWSLDVKAKKTNIVGRFVTLTQSDYPVKMFVLQ